MEIDLVVIPLLKIVVFSSLVFASWLAIKRGFVKIGLVIIGIIVIFLVFIPIRTVNSTLVVDKSNDRIKKEMLKELPPVKVREKRSLDGAIEKYDISHENAQKRINDEINGSI